MWQFANTRVADACYAVIISESTRADHLQAEEKQCYAEEAALLATKWLNARETIPAAEVSPNSVPTMRGFHTHRREALVPAAPVIRVTRVARSSC
jgi:hypothetical protein